ncbi:MAG: YfjI family protein [Thermus sp.]|uniref:DUF3987 domain-containing protein n=1 Tax=Thermus sp. TaxID=275 RepID=UPI0025D71B38|nr:DUF3987 domain-containing protein [Thermus sp.]MCS7219040.1 YfjI family protein [Thermus sp.]
MRAGELLQVALSRRPEGRHDTLLAFLNLAHRGGCLEEAEVLFGHRVLWQAWGVAEDGTRSLETWRDEVARAAQAAASEDYGRKRGLPFLEDQGYDLRGLGWLVSLRWPKPQPLEALLPQLPGWPKGLLPPALEGLVYACSENKGVEATPMAMAVLTAASALLAAKGVTVHPEPGNASWREPPVLWTLLIAPPGFGKSPLIRTAAGPLWKVEEELAQENLQAEEAFRQELAAWEAAPRKERGPKPMPPARHRLVVSDITPEALGEVLAANPAVLALLDEFGGLLAVWRREDRAHGRAFYLSCHSGEPVVVDRLSRGTLYLKRPLLALLGGIQPGPWQAFLGETQRLGREADGLLQRLVPVLGRFTPYREDPPGLGEGILQAYEEALISLWEDPTLQGLTLQPTPEAFRLWRDWRADTEEAVRDPSQPEAWRSLLAKRLGLTARLAGILAVLWGERAITERAMGLAILLVGEVLEAHARKAWRWGSLDLSPALRLGRYLFQHRVEAFTKREVYRNEWGGITTSAEAEAAIGALLRAGWLEERQEGRKTKYFVNPRIGEVCGGPDKA